MDGQGDFLASLTTRFNSLLAEFSVPKSIPPAIFSSEPTSRASLDDPVLSPNAMRLARTRPPSPRFPNSSYSSMSHHSNNSNRAASISGPSTSSQSLPHPHKRDKSHPVLLWLSGNRQPTSTSRPNSAPSSRVTTPTQSNPPSPSAISALSDALHDDPTLAHNRQISQCRLGWIYLRDQSQLVPSPERHRKSGFKCAAIRMEICFHRLYLRRTHGWCSIRMPLGGYRSRQTCVISGKAQWRCS